METPLKIDEELIATAKEMTGIVDTSELIREGLNALVRQEAARRLIELGGSEPDAVAAPRRRSKFSWKERLRILIEG